METDILIDDTYFLNHSQVNYEKIQQIIQWQTEAYLFHRDLGFERLQSLGYVFFVTRTKMTIHQPLSKNETLSTEIQLVSKNALGLTFRIRFYSATKSMIMESLQLWSLIQINTMSVVNAHYFEPIKALVFDFNESPINLKKIPVMETDFTWSLVKKSIPSEDIDRNIHVNNACYIRYIQEALPKETRLREYVINFEKALTLNDHLFINIHQTTDGFDLIGFIHNSDTFETSFRATVKSEFD